MPILWGDRLVGRFDPKLDRATGTLVINGLWLEDRALARDVAFGEALVRGLARFVAFLGAGRIDATAVLGPCAPAPATVAPSPVMTAIGRPVRNVSRRHRAHGPACRPMAAA